MARPGDRHTAVTWQPLTESSVEDVHRVLAEVDEAFGNVVEWSVADVDELLASGAPDLYRSLGWTVVSSQDKWLRPTA